MIPIHIIIFFFIFKNRAHNLDNRSNCNFDHFSGEWKFQILILLIKV